MTFFITWKIVFSFLNGRQVKQNKSVKLRCHFFVHLEYNLIKADMLSKDRNVKWSGNVSRTQCVCNLSALVWDRCASMDRKVPVIVQPFITALNLSNHIQTLVNKRTGINHFECSYTHNTQTDGHNNNNTKRRVYFWRTVLFSRHVSVIIIPGLPHVWSQRAVEHWSSRCAEWDVQKEMIGKAGATFGAKLMPEKNTLECVCVCLCVGGPLCLIIFHFHVLLLHHLV